MNMNEIISINYDTPDRPTVSGRELHKALEIGTAYKDWFPRMCEYGFVEGKDYTPLIFEHPQNKQPCTDHQLTINMAKELCMIQRTDKGKMCRQYFIKVEEAWNSPEMIMKRALDIANSRVRDLQLTVSTLTVENETMRPKAEYFDDLVDRHLLTNIRDTAKELKVKQNVFVKFLLDKKYVYRDKKGKLQPYSSALEDNLFEVKEFVNDKTGFTSTQTLITPKGRETFRLLMIL